MNLLVDSKQWQPFIAITGRPTSHWRQQLQQQHLPLTAVSYCLQPSTKITKQKQQHTYTRTTTFIDFRQQYWPYLAFIKCSPPLWLSIKSAEYVKWLCLQFYYLCKLNYSSFFSLSLLFCYKLPLFTNASRRKGEHFCDPLFGTSTPHLYRLFYFFHNAGEKITNIL